MDMEGGVEMRIQLENLDEMTLVDETTLLVDIERAEMKVVVVVDAGRKTVVGTGRKKVVEAKVAAVDAERKAVVELKGVVVDAEGVVENGFQGFWLVKIQMLIIKLIIFVANLRVIEINGVGRCRWHKHLRAGWGSWSPLDDYKITQDFSTTALQFLCENMNRSQIDHFLKLKWVQDGNPSFSSVHTLFSWIESLPSGSRWQLQEIKVEGYKTAKPMILLWRDSLEVAWHLFANPVFANHIDLDPKNVFVDYNKVEKEYSEFMTAEYAWECQAELPFGATLLGMIGASDKTVVTRGTGGLEMHPIFLTLANIHSEYALATAHKFTNSFGKGRLAYIPLVAWIADLPKQQ
ncbi:hypothetical protein SERLADRAFT_409682 [Serpula lacrymans var. lacrymans S7.9]|uniref:Uncharacterized protein n=1 Tax=Serpula lacrymans var. lacrymans (strain S7.9) TaxID=578457 RepID=F8P2E4_SERL9|nr:uncharacterized protein SERLADRAFT_409682 [Serpula lacrymans var. lacrymans S7.9]EGO23322.1 hypothetical protein SERLADRAFT_409682 [Serpula lacrymans var. lacrymans S7.9]